ncbi:MAG: ribosome-associated translation inhibitor RaiA [Oscillospiraceae bacterium]|nr:ribosome-associated translation inhibitor RaiA [Oscillospiraceae bacterium]
MKFTFTEKRIDATPAMKEYAEKKISKIDKYFKTESEAFVTFSTERGRYIAEVTIKNNGMFYRVKETTGDMCASIDSAVATIERQIRKNKTRLEKRLRTDAFERVVVPMVDDEPEEEFKVVRNKRFSIQPMGVQEAILQMNLLEHEFFAFRNADEGDAFAVVYKRNDGGYGLILDSKD